MARSRKLYKAISLPTGQVSSLVSIGDLPAFNYAVSVDTIAEDVTKHLERHPDLPGVILFKDNELFGMIPRTRIFERLGHRYGVELFLRKPIITLHQNLNLELFSLASHVGIRDAVHYALGRPAQSIYEPLVITYENQDVRMLDVYTLLVAQAQVMDHLNNLVGSLNRIKSALSANQALDETLEIIVQGLKEVVPYHYAAVYVEEPEGLHASSKGALPSMPTDLMAENLIYKSILDRSQPIYIEDVTTVPAWKDIPLSSDLRTWIGLPLQNGDRPLGVLSLARRTASPFSRDEIDIAQVFADYIGMALHAEKSRSNRYYPKEK